MRLIFLIVTITYVAARKIHYTDCGNGEVKSVDVEPCNTDPCEFNPGDKVKLTADIIANQNTNHANISVTVTVGGIPIRYPGIDPDACKVVKCPLVEGGEYKVSMDIDVIKGMPPMTTKMTWKVQGDHKQLVCAYATVILK